MKINAWKSRPEYHTDIARVVRNTRQEEVVESPESNLLDTGANRSSHISPSNTFPATSLEGKKTFTFYLNII